MLADSDPRQWKIYICTGSGHGNNGCQKPVKLHRHYEVSHTWDDKGRYYEEFECPKCKVLTDVQAQKHDPIP
jgi:acetone carboxylase gamma subunit